MKEAIHTPCGMNDDTAGPEPALPQWRLRRRLVISVTKYLMWGLPLMIVLDLIFDRNFVQSLGVPALTGIIGLPGSYLVGRSVQTAIREGRSRRDRLEQNDPNTGY